MNLHNPSDDVLCFDTMGRTSGL